MSNQTQMNIQCTGGAVPVRNEKGNIFIFFRFLYVFETSTQHFSLFPLIRRGFYEKSKSSAIHIG